MPRQWHEPAALYFFNPVLMFIAVAIAAVLVWYLFGVVLLAFAALRGYRALQKNNAQPQRLYCCVLSTFPKL